MVHKTLLLCAVLVSCLTVFTHGAAVIGIDFGTKFMKISLVKPGRPFEIVLNSHTRRKSDTVLAVKDGERLYGSDAAAYATRSPDKVYVRLRELLGRNGTHPALANLKNHHFHYAVDHHDPTGTLKVMFPSMEEKETQKLMLVEELVAMLLQYAQRTAEAFAETPVKDCVITVPSFFTQTEREALLDAAEIAGLNVLSLIDENTASALQYGIDRVFPDTKHRMLLYNMGAMSTQVSLFEYTGKYLKRGSQNITQGEFTTLSKAWDEDLGGDAFDRILFEQFADEFDAKNKGEKIRSHGRAVHRLLKVSTKTKEILSANMETPVQVESIWNDIDFRTHATRGFLEGKLAQHKESVTSPIDVVLAAANLTLADVDAVELVGGSTRVPFVKKTLREYFGQDMELGNHLNGDESMALGAVFHGANLSTAFRVRHVGMTETTPYAVGVRLTNLEDAQTAEVSQEEPVEEVSDDDESEGNKTWKKRATLFKRFSNLVSRKVVTFQHDKDISCKLNYEVAEDTILPLPTATDSELAVYDVTGVKEANDLHGHLGKSKLSLTFNLDINGISKLVKAEALFTEMVEVKVPVKKNATETAGKSKAKTTDSEEPITGDKEEDKEKAAEAEGDADKEEATDGEKSAEGTAEEETATEEGDATKAEEEPEYTIETKKQVHRVPLTITRSDRGIHVKVLAKEDKDDAKKFLADWNEKDMERVRRATAMNLLESFIFESRDRIRSNEEEVALVTTEEEVEKLMDDMMEIEDWLYEDEGMNAETKVYEKKKSDLGKRVNQIFLKANELQERPAAAAETKQLFDTLRATVATWETERPWVTEEEKKDLLDRVADVEAWLAEVEEAQDKLTARDEPAFVSSDIRSKLEPVQRSLEKLLKKRKPKPPKKVAKEEDKEEKSEDPVDGEATNEQDAEADKPEDVKEDETKTATEEEAHDEL